MPAARRHQRARHRGGERAVRRARVSRHDGARHRAAGAGEPGGGALPLRLQGDALPRGAARAVRRHHGELEQRGARLTPQAPRGRRRRALRALLRTRIAAMLELLLGPPPGLPGTLMMREMCDPSAALPDIVEQFIQPQKREMETIVAALLPRLGRRRRSSAVSSASSGRCSSTATCCRRCRACSGQRDADARVAARRRRAHHRVLARRHAADRRARAGAPGRVGGGAMRRARRRRAGRAAGRLHAVRGAVAAGGRRRLDAGAAARRGQRAGAGGGRRRPAARRGRRRATPQVYDLRARAGAGGAGEPRHRRGGHAHRRSRAQQALEARGLLLPSTTAQRRLHLVQRRAQHRAEAARIRQCRRRFEVVLSDSDAGTINALFSQPIDLSGELRQTLAAAQAGYRGEAARRWATELEQDVAVTRAYFDRLAAAAPARGDGADDRAVRAAVRRRRSALSAPGA